jgi:translation initiation factor IF-2
MIEDVETVLRGLLGPEQEEFECGRAKVLAIFTHKKQMIAGVRVTQGYIKKGCKLSVLRQDETVSQATIKEIRIFQDIVEKAQDQAECGLTLERYQQECQIGDILIVTDMREIQNTVEYRV